MNRDCVLGPVNVPQVTRDLCVTRAYESYGGNISAYLRGLIYADLFTSGKISPFIERPCEMCHYNTNHCPTEFDKTSLLICVVCGNAVSGVS